MKNTDYRTSKICKGLAKGHWRLAKLIGPLPVANCQTGKERRRT